MYFGSKYMLLKYVCRKTKKNQVTSFLSDLIPSVRFYQVASSRGSLLSGFNYLFKYNIFKYYDDS